MRESQFFLDTNVIIRFLEGDSPESAERARTIMMGLDEGTISADITEVVIFECVYILTNQYKRSREYLTEALSTILSLASVRVKTSRD